MAGLTYSLDAWVLNKRPPAESFQTLTVFSVTHGAQTALQRISQKANSASVLDLFDEASLIVEEPNSGQSVFVKEVRILTRHSTLGKNYETLRLASFFAKLVGKNPAGAESRASIYDLLRDSFRAFAETERPDIVYLKSVYRFCRDEGYPLKQAWMPILPATDRRELVTILNQPVSEQTAEPKLVARLQRSLDDYLRGETELQLE